MNPRAGEPGGSIYSTSKYDLHPAPRRSQIGCFGNALLRKMPPVDRLLPIRRHYAAQGLAVTIQSEVSYRGDLVVFFSVLFVAPEAARKRAPATGGPLDHRLLRCHLRPVGLRRNTLGYSSGFLLWNALAISPHYSASD